MKIFEEKGQPDKEETQHLARSLNMSKKMIKDWFAYMVRKEKPQLRIGEQYPAYYYKIRVNKIQVYATFIPKCSCNSSV